MLPSSQQKNKPKCLMWQVKSIILLIANNNKSSFYWNKKHTQSLLWGTRSDLLKLFSSTFRRKPLLSSIPPLFQGIQKVPFNYQHFFFSEKHSWVDEWVSSCSISKVQSWGYFALALTCRYPYKVDNSSGLSWISECSFWPRRRHYWVFHSFMSVIASMFNSRSKTPSKPYCYLINICAWFPGQLLFLRAVIKLPQQMLFLWGETYGFMRILHCRIFFIFSAFLILFCSLINLVCLSTKLF